MTETTRYEPYTPGRPGPEESLPEQRHRSSYSCGSPDGLTTAAIVCVVIWAMSGFGYFWPIWVILPAVLFGGLRLPRPAAVRAALGKVKPPQASRVTCGGEVEVSGRRARVRGNPPKS